MNIARSLLELGLIAALAPALADAAESIDLSPPKADLAEAPAAAQVQAGGQDAISAYFAGWGARAARARASQPSWSSPLATTTGLLEQRFRFDAQEQHAGNGADTTVLDGGKGLDLIVGETNEIQIAAPAYDIRRTPTGKRQLSGFADGQFLRVEQRLASSPASGDDYVLTAWLAVQAPTGIAALTSNAWTYLPTVAFGKGWGSFDIQGTLGAAIPASHTKILGDQVQTNIAFQEHIEPVFWPEVEVNSTYYSGGQRNGLTQVYVTPGLVIGRFALGEGVLGTFGFGYQIAVSPDYRPKPLTPSYQNAWILTSRFNF